MCGELLNTDTISTEFTLTICTLIGRLAPTSVLLYEENTSNLARWFFDLTKYLILIRFNRFCENISGQNEIRTKTFQMLWVFKCSK